MASYKRQWHLENKEEHNRQIRKNSQKALSSLNERICVYLSSHPCVDCGESDIVVLEFDHLDPSQKILCISTMVTRLAPWSKIEEEIKKCVVRCANCHRRKTCRIIGSYRYGRGTEVQTQIHGLEDRSPIQLNDAPVETVALSS